MKNLFKTLFIPSGEKKSITAYETWVVRWTGRDGEFSGDSYPEAEIFTTQEDANEFADRLREAFALVRNTSRSGTKVSVSKQ